MNETLETRIQAAYAQLLEVGAIGRDRDALLATVEEVIELLDRGKVRVAEKQEEDWVVHPWLKQAILLYFHLRPLETVEIGAFEFHDRIPLKHDFASQGVRVVPHAICRHGAHLERGVVLMPSYVNIGAFVGAGSMIDTWATVGSCAQVGREVHVSGGVGIGGVLEPLQASPVIIEDGAFLGSRAIVVEGVRVGEEAVLGAGVVLTASTPILDVTGAEPTLHRGSIPPRSVVIPGTTPKRFAAGEFQVPCALIIGQRKESTDRKTSLNDVLREHAVAV